MPHSRAKKTRKANKANKQTNKQTAKNGRAKSRQDLFRLGEGDSAIEMVWPWARLTAYRPCSKSLSESTTTGFWKAQAMPGGIVAGWKMLGGPLFSAV